MDTQTLLDHVYDKINREMRYRDFNAKNHVCIIYTKKKILSVGVNYNLQNGSIHAEMDAVRRLPKNKTNKILKINMFISRISNENQNLSKNQSHSKSNFDYFKLSKPCHHCLTYMASICMIKKYHIDRILYTTDTNIEDKSYTELYNEPHFFTFYYKYNQNAKLIARPIR